MTLLIAVFAAVISTVVWYQSKTARELKVGVLCWLYWGASIMWLADAIFEFAELRTEFFRPAAEDVLNDAFLGLSAVALGLVIWLVIVLVKDPKGVIKAELFRKNG